VRSVTIIEGGMVLTADPALHEKIRLIRDHGMRRGKRYWHDVVGFNFRLPNLVAAVGCAQFEAIGRVIAERRRVHATYREALTKIPEVRPQLFRAEVEPVLWAMAVRLLAPAAVEGREAIMGALAEAGIETRPGFYDLGQLPPYASPSLPVAHAVSRSVLSLPTYPDLGDGEIAYICDTLGRVLGGFAHGR
jgi:perosamine synthetase